MKYTVEHISIEVSKFDRRFKKFVTLPDENKREYVEEIIRNNTDYRINPFDEYDILEEARKNSTDLYYDVRNGLLFIEYDEIWQNDEENETTDLIESTY